MLSTTPTSPSSVGGVPTTSAATLATTAAAAAAAASDAGGAACTISPSAAVQQNDKDYLVRCRCDNARAVVTLLHCLKDVWNGGGSTTGRQQHSTLNPSTRDSSGSIRRSMRPGASVAAAASAVSSSSLLQPVTVYCTTQGLTFHVTGTSKQSQASIELPAALFSLYEITEEGADFCVNLMTLLDCLSVLLSSSSSSSASSTSRDDSFHANNHSTSTTTMISMNGGALSFTYSLSQEILQLEYDSGSFLCTAAIPGMVPPNLDDDDASSTNSSGSRRTGPPRPAGHSLARAFGTCPIQARVLIQSSLLREVVLPELISVAGATTGTLAIQRTRTNERQPTDGGACIEFATIGHSSHGLVQVTDSSGTMIKTCDSTNRQGRNHNNKIQYSYPMSTLLQAFQGLELAQETCLTINGMGILAIQHQVLLPLHANHHHYHHHHHPPQEVHDGLVPTFCDFLMTCLQDDDDDDDDDDNDQEQEEDATASVPQETSPCNQSQTSSRRVVPVIPDKPHKKNNNNIRHDKNNRSQSTSYRSSSSSTNRRRTKPTESLQSQESQPTTLSSSQPNEDDAGWSISRSQTNTTLKRNHDNTKSNNDTHDPSDSDEDNDDEDSTTRHRRRRISAVSEPLFGTVVVTTATTTTDRLVAETTRRRRRRRTFPLSGGTNTSPSTGSVDLLAESGTASDNKVEMGEGDNNDDDDDDVDEELVHIARRHSEITSQQQQPQQRRQRGEPFHSSSGSNEEQSPCSSPELVYGQQ